LQNAIVMAIFGGAIATACVVSSDGDGVDDDDGGSSGASSKGGSTSKGGTSSTGGTTGVAGETAQGGDTSAGGVPAGGTGGTTAVEPMCDPAESGGQGGGSMVVGTPYPDCEPTDESDACQACIKTSCCEASKNCNAYDPENVCGYGGPTEYVGQGGEFLCWQTCVNEGYDPEGAGGASDVLSEELTDGCLFDCATPDCGLPGDETLTLAECALTNCDADCFY
jgi:hypothetical protein